MDRPSSTGPDDLSVDYALASRLTRTWPAFFGRFGRLRPVQRIVIPEVLAGADVLVCAQTAAGKTEAACAPLVERLLGRWSEWTLLYISPTRALVNDLYGRLCGPLEQLGLRVARRTGDHKDSLDAPAHVVLTTPESFDSLLCRGRSEHRGHVLASVCAVVLDEIHLLHGSPRGEQVRWLLERLRRLRRQAVQERWSPTDALQIVGLSATVPDPERVRAAYMPSGRVIEVSGGRTIDVVTAPTAVPDVENSLPAYLAALSEPEKVLVFANARKRVDDLARTLRDSLAALGYEVRGHHGSLAQPEREAAERAIKTRDKIVLISTSTLEIGVDIGDIDLVVLDGPAPDLPALLQRIGRGNRRSDHTRVMTCSGSLAEALLHDAMIAAARVGFLGEFERGPQFAVARQQAASYVFQARTRSRSVRQLHELFAVAEPSLNAATFLRHLCGEGDLVEDESGIRLGRFADATARGEIHSNIESAPGASVVDFETGAQIALGVRYDGGRSLSIAGNPLEVKTWRDRKLEVRRQAQAGHEDARWGYVSGAWFTGAGQPQSVRRYLGIPESQWPIVDHAGESFVFHLGGGRRQAVLRLISDRELQSGVRTITPWYVRFRHVVESKPTWLGTTGPAMLDLLLGETLDTLERLLARPSANRYLPREVRVAEVREWLRAPSEVDAAQNSDWNRGDQEVAHALRLLCQLK
jgi:ATP-dependent helicase Lhr and Lhr-like helicase